MMLNEILNALKARTDLAGWTVREIRSSGVQFFAVPKGIEAARRAETEKYHVVVFCRSRGADGAEVMGQGDVTILPGGNIEEALSQAALIAGLVSNPVYSLPGPADMPDVELVDPELRADPEGTLRALMDAMRRAGAATPGVRMTAGECFGDILHTRLVNSRGVDAEEDATQTSLEFVLRASRDGREVERFEEMTRRRASDLHVEAAIEDSARAALDMLGAGGPPAWQGPVVLRGHALAGFMYGDDLNGSVIQFHSSAASKYGKYSAWEPGQPIFRGEAKGDPLTVWANRALPFGTNSNRFDAEGLPASRVELIRDNLLVNYTSNQKYADYLGLPATGEFGSMEVKPGPTPAADLLREPYVEVMQFSWFNPDAITGEFATEVRLGYLVEGGVRKPFQGGLLIGNYMDALANVRWSAETGFFGNYMGPHTARFEGLKLAGESS